MFCIDGKPFCCTHDSFHLCRESGNQSRLITPITKESGCTLRSTTLSTALTLRSTSLTTSELSGWICGRCCSLLLRWLELFSIPYLGAVKWVYDWKNKIAGCYSTLTWTCKPLLIPGKVWDHLWQLPDHRWCEGSWGIWKRNLGRY